MVLKMYGRNQEKSGEREGMWGDPGRHAFVCQVYCDVVVGRCGMSFCGCSGQSKLNSLSPELDSMGNAESFCCFRDLKMPPVPPFPPLYLL